MLNGRKVILRALTRDDLERICRFNNDLEVELAGGGDPPEPQSLERLQAEFDRDVEAFLPRAWLLKQQKDRHRLHTDATALMQKHVRLFQKECRRLRGVQERSNEVSYAAEEYVSYIS